MPRHPRSVDNAIARFDEMAARFDGHTPAARGAARRHYSRGLASVGRRVSKMGAALGLLIVATIAFGLVVGPIGLGGLFLVVTLAVLILLGFAMLPDQPRERKFSDDMPNRQVVQTLDSYIVRRRNILPAPASRRLDAISAQLPLLESRLGEVDMLDPLAQDARRLMGKHLPELIERYERVPPAYRLERDGEGLTVEERLVASLDAAKEALDDIGVKLAREDLNAFETQGRFIESRYRENGRYREE
jgi:hypothetical protein